MTPKQSLRTDKFIRVRKQVSIVYLVEEVERLPKRTSTTHKGNKDIKILEAYETYPKADLRATLLARARGLPMIHGIYEGKE